MQVKKFNISKPKKYTDKSGEEKTQWNNIGTVTEFHKQDGSVGRIMEIPAIGLEANIFPMQDKRQDQVDQEYNQVQSEAEAPQDAPEGEISPSEIPF